MFYDEWLNMKKRQTRRDQEPDYFTKNTRMIESKRKFVSQTKTNYHRNLFSLVTEEW
jgi:hypothetical protein